jgi:hypothetical protein
MKSLNFESISVTVGSYCIYCKGGDGGGGDDDGVLLAGGRITATQ